MQTSRFSSDYINLLFVAFFFLFLLFVCLFVFFLVACFRYAPIGVCSLIAQRVASMVDIGGELRRLALFIATVLAGLSIHAFVILPLIFFAVRKANPFIFMYGMKDAFVTAFGISSRYSDSYSLLVFPNSA